MSLRPSFLQTRTSSSTVPTSEVSIRLQRALLPFPELLPILEQSYCSAGNSLSSAIDTSDDGCEDVRSKVLRKVT